MVPFHTSRWREALAQVRFDQGLGFGTGSHFVGNLGACLLYFSGFMYPSLFFPFSFISLTCQVSNAFSFSRFLLSIFVSLSDSRGPMVLSASSSPFGFCVISFGVFSRLFLNHDRNVLSYSTLLRLLSLSLSLVFLMICFQNVSSVGYRIFTQVKSVRGLLPECITTRSLLPFGGISTLSPSAFHLDVYKGGIFLPIYPIARFLPVCTRGFWMFLLKIPIFHVAFYGMRFSYHVA